MNFGGPLFIVAIVLITTLGWVMMGWIRARHGSPNADGHDGLSAERQIEILANENEGLKGKIGRLEERLAVLERIATDPAERTAREIDNLR